MPCGHVRASPSLGRLADIFFAGALAGPTLYRAAQDLPIHGHRKGMLANILRADGLRLAESHGPAQTCRGTARANPSSLPNVEDAGRRAIGTVCRLSGIGAARKGSDGRHGVACKSAYMATRSGRDRVTGAPFPKTVAAATQEEGALRQFSCQTRRHMPDSSPPAAEVHTDN